VTAAILLVEDNPITTKLVRFTLETEHYRVIEASDGARARAMFREHRPSLILLDLLLPDIGGFDLLHELRALPHGRDVPILAFTGLLSERDEARLSDAGFDDVVSKPIEPSRLVQIVRGYLPSSETPAPVPVTGEAPRTLVLADDDAVQRKLVALRLQRAGYKVISTVDGQDALERVREVRPFAVVSDVLMPRLDGFGLCMAVRNDPELADTPIILISNSYLDVEDKALAARVGADGMLVRTPDLREVIAMLGAPMKRAPRRRSAPVSIDPDLERERIRRMMNQLERQGAMHAGLTQRCSLLSAELSVLSGISEAVATEDDLEGALHQILASCFDAGGISLGMLYLSGPEGVRGMRFGHVDGWTDRDIASFFGHRDLLDAAIRDQRLVCIPSAAGLEAQHATLLERTTARSLMIAPLGHKGQALGALVTMSHTLETQTADSIAFAQAVAGQISLALALARSFQAKDASERTARANATVLRSILDSMAEGVIVSDERGDVTHWNHAATSILRLPAEQLSREALDASLPLAPDGASIDRAEVRIHRADEDSWLSVNARPLGDDPSSAHGRVAVFRDVTDERAARARMLVSERMASLGTLAAGVGHEINNPLMAVLGNLDMALSDVRRLRRDHAALDLEELADELHDAREAAERVRNIVRDLKLFSRSDEESRGEVQVERALESSIRMVWNEVRHRATLVRDYKPVPPVYANESRLGQVFLNLIVNAAQAIPEGRASQNQIRVGTSLAADGRVRIEVTDSGSGMSPEVVAQLFTPFFTTKPIGVGTGLGLSICHQLVSAIGGEITVETQPGAGTTFAVLLPALAPVARATRATTSTDAPATRRGRVLIVDDEQMVATTFRRALASAHDVTAADPMDAIRMITDGEEFDVILCDLMMPNVTGMDLYAELSRVAPVQAARMVFITGGAFTMQGREFLEHTKNRHLEKPIDLDALRALVNTAVRSVDEASS
jgi:DNA-binding response OmpR family regulator/signal transduction histidine kinase